MATDAPRRWLVTGGAGFFGVHMCRALAARGEDVVSFDIEDFPREELLPGIRAVTGDVCDAAALTAAMAGVDAVIHAAAALALAPPEVIDAVNAGGTRTVLEAAAAAGVRRVVTVGTTAVYGMPRFHPIDEDAPLDPMGPYGIAKAKAEQFAVGARGVETVRLRPKSFIGTGRLGIFQILFDWIEAGARIPVLGDGNNRFQLLEVTDLVEAARLAALRGVPGAVYNIGATDFGTVNEDLGALLQHSGSGSRILHIPSRPTKLLLGALSALRLSPVYRWVYDTADQDSWVSTARAERDLGWRPRHSNRDALTGTYDWYLAEGKRMAQATGTSHRVAWKQGVLGVAKAVLRL